MARTPQWLWLDELGAVRSLLAVELREAIHSGRIGTGVLVWFEGMNTWVALERVPTFADACRSAPKPVHNGNLPGKLTKPSHAALEALKRTKRELTGPPDEFGPEATERENGTLATLFTLDDPGRDASQARAIQVASKRERQRRVDIRTPERTVEGTPTTHLEPSKPIALEAGKKAKAPHTQTLAGVGLEGEWLKTQRNDAVQAPLAGNRHAHSITSSLPAFQGSVDSGSLDSDPDPATIALDETNRLQPTPEPSPNILDRTLDQPWVVVAQGVPSSSQSALTATRPAHPEAPSKVPSMRPPAPSITEVLRDDELHEASPLEPRMDSRDEFGIATELDEGVDGLTIDGRTGLPRNGEAFGRISTDGQPAPLLPPPPPPPPPPPLQTSRPPTPARSNLPAPLKSSRPPPVEQGWVEQNGIPLPPGWTQTLLADGKIAPEPPAQRVAPVPLNRTNSSRSPRPILALEVQEKTAQSQALKREAHRIRVRTWVMGAVALSIAVLVGGVGGAFLGRTTAPKCPKSLSSACISVSAPSASSAASSPSPADLESTRPCRASGVSKRLATSIARETALELWASPASDHVAIGFATRSSQPRGLVIDPINLSTQREFALTRRDGLHRIVPASRDGIISFHVDVADQRTALELPLTVSVRDPVQVGVHDGELAMQVQGRNELRTLWELPQDAQVSALRTVVRSETEFALVARIGKSIFLGWVDTTKGAVGPLHQVDDNWEQVGAPSIASDDSGILMTFASLDRSGAWELRASRAKHNEPPSSSEPVKTPPGGPGGATIAPFVASVPGKRWLLVWTEGTSGSHAVRMQTLTHDLRPLDHAPVITASDMSAGQGVAAIGNNHGLVAFLTASGRTFDLWAVAVSCQ